MCLVLVVQLLFTGSYVHVSHAADVMVHDTFNDQAGNQDLVGWSKNAGIMQVVSVTDSAYANEKSLQILNNSPTVFAEYDRTIAPQSGNVLVQFRMKFTDPNYGTTSGISKVIRFYSSSNVQLGEVTFVQDKGALLKFTNSNSIYKIPNSVGIEADEWFSMSIVFDLANAQYGAWMGDSQDPVTLHPLYSTSSDIAKLKWIFKNEDTETEIDDVKISSLTTAELDLIKSGVEQPPHELENIWNMDQLTLAPEVEAVTTVKETVNYTVKSLLYKNEPYMGTDTKIFAIYGYPKTASATQKVPAMLLLHGGGGYAYQEWVEQWTAKGYAAIAIDMNGSNSAGVGGPTTSEVDRFTKISNGNLKEMWSYHATTAAIRAVSFLENQPEVNPEKIGVMGISWGGYFTNMVAGLDTRLNLAMPVYGSGFIYEDSAWKSILMNNLTAGQRQLWIDYFDPSSYLANAQMPMLYANGTNDGFYPIEIWQKSYQLVQGEVSLRLITDSVHGNRENWNAPDFVAFADMHFKEGVARPKVVDQGLVDEHAWVNYSSPENINAAMLVYTTDTGVGRTWEQTPVSINHSEKMVTTHLPANTKSYYYNLIDSIGSIVSSEIMTTSSIIVGPQEPEPELGNLLFNDNFNDQAGNQDLVGWSKSAGTMQVVPVTANDNSLQIINKSTTVFGEYDRTIAPQSGNVLVQFRMKFTDPNYGTTSGISKVIRFYNSSNVQLGEVTFVQDKGALLKFTNSNSIYKIPNSVGIEADEWFSMNMVFDLANAQYGAWMGDSQDPVTLHPLYSTSSDIAKLKWIFKNDDPGNEIDDVKVSTLTSAELDDIKAGNVYTPTVETIRMEINAAVELYVDPSQGNDTNPGTLAAPFASLEKARDYVRTINSNMVGDIVVNLREGTYKPQSVTVTNIPLINKLDSTAPASSFPLRTSSLVFEERDSGTNGFNIIYKSYEDETPVISGGMNINDWSIHDADKNIYKAFVGTELETRQLYVNGTRAIRARSTGGLANGTYNIDSYSNGNPSHTTTDLSMASWGNIQDVEFVYKNIFTVSRLGIDYVSEVNNRLNIYMKKPGSYYVTHKGGTSAVLPGYIENAYELLDSEGEWYLNRSTGYLYYKPTPAEDMSSADVVVPVVDELLKLQGSSVNNTIHHIQFRDINFEYTGWLRPNGVNGHSDTQNNHIREWGLSPDYNDVLADAAITLEYARSILFERSEFSKMGITGINIVKGSQNNLIRGNKFNDISGNAISVGDPAWRGAENKNNINPDDFGYLLYNNDILNNEIHDIAKEYQSGTAISAAYPIEMDISHNEIYNVPYSGIHFGYGWGEVNPVTQSNRIQNNYIDTFMSSMTDGGAIYAIGATNGTPTNPNVISGNFIRNQGEPKYGALYFDMGSSNWVVEDNVMENTPIWAHVNIANSANENISINNSYITGGDLLFRPELNQPNIQISEPQVYPDANWPFEARQLLVNAGLESGYADLRQDYYDLSEVQFTSKDSNLESGHTLQLHVEGKTVRGVYADLTQDEILYVSTDTQVATVDGNGLVTALSFGVTEISAEVTSNGITKVAQTFIYVDDELDRIELSAPYSKLKAGDSQQLTAIGVTAIGGIVPLASLTYTSNSSAVTINESGNMTGVGAGIAEISVTGTYAGISRTTIFEVEIVDAPSGNVALDYPYWYVSGSGTKIITSDSIKLTTPSGYAMYQNKFPNEILDFNMEIDTTDSDWPSVTLRSPIDTIRPVNAGNSGYVISFKKNVIEVQRFNDGVRTVIYGDIAGFPSLAGDAILNTMVQFRENHHIQVGAINEGDHVRIKLIVDDITVVDYLDTASNSLTEPGYFGVIVGAGSMKLSNPNLTPPADVIAPVSVASVQSVGPTGSNGWYTSDVRVSLTVNDNLSGVAGTEYQVNNGAWTNYTGSIPALGEGNHTVSYRSMDLAGNLEQTQTITFKIDKTSPLLVVELDQSTIWPANHKMVKVNAALNSSDAASDIASVVLTSITSDEPDSGQGDIQANIGTTDTSFSLRAERSGSGKGRTYTISYTATDNAGNQTVTSATVKVPHDRSGK
jgi:dienelactone hydrolase